MDDTGEGFLNLPAATDGDPTLVWSEVFGDEQPVQIELGIGKGRFILDAAARLPEVNFVGVEWAAKYLRIAHHRAGRRQLANIRFARTDAREFVEFFVPAASVQAYHIYFPDPWPKKRHWKNRLLYPTFLNKLAERSLLGCRLYFRTDHEEYFDWALHTLESVESWQLVEGAAWPFERETVFQAKAESYQSLVAQRC